MNDLIKQIVEKTGIPADKAQQVLVVVSGFVKQKFPAIGSQIDSALGTGNVDSKSSAGNDLLGEIGGKLGFLIRFVLICLTAKARGREDR